MYVSHTTSGSDPWIPSFLIHPCFFFIFWAFPDSSLLFLYSGLIPLQTSPISSPVLCNMSFLGGNLEPRIHSSCSLFFQASGNKVSRQSVLCGSQNIVLNGKVRDRVSSKMHICAFFPLIIKSARQMKCYHVSCLLIHSKVLF